jgi:hypothetical protein
MMNRINSLFFILGIAATLIFGSCSPKKESADERKVWTKEQANAWYGKQGWMRGCNFIPSTAINQLEMWQAETFDTATIDRELGWAESIGMNTMRVYLHHLAWQTDSGGFKKNIGQYLSIADKHNIRTIFVIFDDCWNGEYKAGKQPEPKTGVHNSGWIKDPGDLIHKDSILPMLETYVKDILSTFGKDNRIVMWDLYNEPGAYEKRSMNLLTKVFAWAHQINPSQPVSSGIWNKKLVDFNKFQIENSDVINYHNYDNDSSQKLAIDSLRIYGKPLICTEYMARRSNSLFTNVMPLLKKENVAAINWGLVSGKTNTIYGWDDPHPDGSEPSLWFHDIFRKDGTPYKQEEIDFIKKLTGKQ